MKAVTNSSGLIALSSIGQLELIHQRFPDGVLLPKAVWKEVVETGAGRPGAEQVAQTSCDLISCWSKKAIFGSLSRTLEILVHYLSKLPCHH